MYHNNLNPKKIKTFKIVNGKINSIAEEDFNLIDWVDERFKKYFTDEEIIKAIYELDLTFKDLTKLSNVSVNALDKTVIYLPKVYHISYDTPTHKSGKHRFGSAYSTDTYSVNIPNDLINGDLGLKLLNNKYDFTNKKIYNDINVVSFDLVEFSTSFKNLTDLPVQLRSLTVEQLLSLNKVDYEERTSKFHIFMDLENFYFSPKDDSIKEFIHYPVLHINLNSFVNGDWNSIEEKTRNYYKSYYSGGWSNVEANYPHTKERMKWIDELFELPEILELKKDILNNAHE
jgi:hypothetical protein